jgi:NitT/TauT family transport system substrate-binding protein
MITLLAIAIIGLAGCNLYRQAFPPPPSPSPEPSPTPSFDPRVLTVGIDSRPGGMLFYAVNHYVPKNKFQLRPVIIEDPGERWARMAAGELDMAFAPLPEFVLGFARHDPGAVICFPSSSSGCDGIVASPEVESLEGLAGKRVALVPGSAGHFFLIKALDSRGKSTAEVNIIPAPFNDTAFTYLSGGRVDGAALQGERLEEARGRFLPLLSTNELSPIPDVLCASRFALKNRPQDLQLIVNACYQMVEFINKNPGLAKKLISSRSGKPIEEVERMLGTLKLKTLEEAKAPPKDTVVDSMRKIQQVWSIENLPNADGKLDFDRAFNPLFMERAVVNPADPLLPPL